MAGRSASLAQRIVLAGGIKGLTLVRPPGIPYHTMTTLCEQFEERDCLQDRVALLCRRNWDFATPHTKQWSGPTPKGKRQMETSESGVEAGVAVRAQPELMGREESGVVTVDRSSPWATPARLVVLALAALIGVWLAIVLRDLLIQLVIATILAAGIMPLTVWLTRIGLPRGVSVLLIYLVLLLAVVGLGFLLVPPVVVEVQSLVAQAPDFGARFVHSLESLQQQFPFLPPIGPALQDQVKHLGDQAGTIFAQALNLVGVALGVFGGLFTTLLTL